MPEPLTTPSRDARQEETPIDARAQGALSRGRSVLSGGRAAHKLEQRRRLAVICKRLGTARPELLAARLALLIDGAFTSGALLLGDGAGKALRGAGAALVEAAAQ